MCRNATVRQTVIDFQAVQLRLGNAAWKTECRTAADLARRRECPERAARCARLVGGEVLLPTKSAREVCGHAVQLMGGYGLLQ